VHGWEQRCRNCLVRYDPIAIYEKHQEASSCKKREITLDGPELLSTKQELAMAKLKHGLGSYLSDTEKYRKYYQALFPGDPRGENVPPCWLASTLLEILADFLQTTIIIASITGSKKLATKPPRTLLQVRHHRLSYIHMAVPNISNTQKLRNTQMRRSTSHYQPTRLLLQRVAAMATSLTHICYRHLLSLVIRHWCPLWR
jgi:hypothetical protein